MPENLDPKYIGIGIAPGSGMGVAVGLAIGAGPAVQSKGARQQ